MTKKPIAISGLLIILLSFSILFACSCSLDRLSMLESAAIHVQSIVQKELNNLDADMAEAAVALGKSGLSGAEARQILNNLYHKNDYIVDCSATDTAGIMVTIMPEMYSSHEGTDISHQEVMIEFNKDRKPDIPGVSTSQL